MVDKDAIVIKKKTGEEAVQVMPISPTFYARLFRTIFLHEAFFVLTF
jgi:hypothetical protein